MEEYSTRTRGQPFNLHLGLDQSVTPCHFSPGILCSECSGSSAKPGLFKLEMHSGAAECWLASPAAALKPLELRLSVNSTSFYPDI